MGGWAASRFADSDADARQQQLRLHRLPVTLGVDRFLDVVDVVIPEASNDVGEGVGGADQLEESLAFA